MSVLRMTKAKGVFGSLRVTGVAQVDGALTFGGTVSAAAASFTSITGTGNVALTGNLTVTTGKNVVLATTGAGTQIGTGATQLLGLWGATPVVQPTRAGQLTDNSGGVSGAGTIAVIAGGGSGATAATVASTAAAVATLAARVNDIEARLSAAGGGVGLTA